MKKLKLDDIKIKEFIILCLKLDMVQIRYIFNFLNNSFEQKYSHEKLFQLKQKLLKFFFCKKVEIFCLIVFQFFFNLELNLFFEHWISIQITSVFRIIFFEPNNTSSSVPSVSIFKIFIYLILFFLQKLSILLVFTLIILTIFLNGLINEATTP